MIKLIPLILSAMITGGATIATQSYLQEPIRADLNSNIESTLQSNEGGNLEARTMMFNSESDGSVKANIGIDSKDSIKLNINDTLYADGFISIAR